MCRKLNSQMLLRLPLNLMVIPMIMMITQFLKERIEREDSINIKENIEDTITIEEVGIIQIMTVT